MKRSLFGNAMANMVQMVAGTALLLLLYRYINMRLGTAALGIWSVVLAVGSASRLADFGISASVTRFVARYLALENEDGAAAAVETALLTLLIFFSLLLPFLYYPLKLALVHVFSGENLAQAQNLLPYALVSLGLAILSAVVQSGMNGIQRMDLRAGVVLASQFLFVLLAVRLIPSWGLVGLAWAQIIQGLISLIGGWLLLGRHLNRLSWAPFRWSRHHFREMLQYGVNVQAATLLMLVVDPLTKALMARFGGAEAAGLFEIANQIAMKLRSFVVIANQAIVPKISEMKEKSPQKIHTLYIKNFNFLFYLSLSVFIFPEILVGVLSYFFVGFVSESFIIVFAILSFAWIINIFTGPAYFINLGIGLPKRNTVAHAIMACTNPVLGWVLGSVLGGVGVALAFAIAVSAGSGFLMIDYQKRTGSSLGSLELHRHVNFIVISLALMVGGGWIWYRHPVLSVENGIVTGILMLAAMTILWQHPYRKKILEIFGRATLGN